MDYDTNLQYGPDLLGDSECRDCQGYEKQLQRLKAKLNKYESDKATLVRAIEDIVKWADTRNHTTSLDHYGIIHGKAQAALDAVKEQKEEDN